MLNLTNCRELYFGSNNDHRVSHQKSVHRNSSSFVVRATFCLFVFFVHNSSSKEKEKQVICNLRRSCRKSYLPSFKQKTEKKSVKFGGFCCCLLCRFLALFLAAGRCRKIRLFFWVFDNILAYTLVFTCRNRLLEVRL